LDPIARVAKSLRAAAMASQPVRGVD
jgi:hypothetical protein